MNPAASVRGPKYVVKKGKTFVLWAEQARTLIDSIPLVEKDEDTGDEKTLLLGLRDRALISVMAFSFARISAVVHMDVEDIGRTATGITGILKMGARSRSASDRGPRVANDDQIV